jgi:hypothetical protein
VIATWRRLVRAAVVVGPLACRAAPAIDTSWHDEPGHRWRALARPSDQITPGFTSLDSTSTGIGFRNTVSLEKALANRILAQGAGVAIGDVNGDELPDIFLGRTEGPSALYLNRGGLRFEDGAATAGVAFGDRAVTGVALVDLDGDGDLDLLVNALGGPNGLFRNDGRGVFAEDTGFVDRGSKLGSTTSTIADIDGDGDLDIYTTNYKAYTTLDRLSPQERAFDQIVRRHGPREFTVHPRYRQDYRVYLRDDLRGVSLVQRADPDRLLLNDGTGRFTAAPMFGPRFQDEDGRPLAEAREDFGLAARFYDVDGDGDPDLFVANDFEDPDQFWINDGHGQFRLITRTALRTTSNSGMAIDFADIDRDGEVDLFEVDMLSRDSRRLKTQIPTQTVLPKMPGVVDDRPQLQRNTLFRNRGDGTFAQIAEYAGVDASGWTWGTTFLDVDLDGYEDILVANGHRWDVLDADVLERLKNRLSVTGWQRELTLFPPLELPNYAFRNRGDLTFEDQTAAWRFGLEPDVSHGMATGDLDGDGDLDVVINRLDRPALVLRNDASANRVAIQLKGAGANRRGIGATVRVLGGAVPFQSREVTAGGLYLSHAEDLVAFAAGGSDSLLIEVRWRSGQRSVVAHARPNRLYQITEPTGPGVAPAPPAPDSAALFADATDSLGHVHHENWYDDAARQLLLPNLFSQLGPGATWSDLDGDGDDDLLLGTGQGGRPAWYRNDRGRFAAVPFGGTPPGDLTTLLALPGSSGPTIVAGVSSYEAASPAAALALSSVVAFPVGPNARDGVAIVPGDSASVGPLAAADYDGDGDLDLFVGGRIIPGRYPLSPRSRLFRNEGARGFQADQANTMAVGHPGMVSSALFTDLDDDGDPDLVLAIEWGPIKVFQNDAGRFSPAPAGLGFGNRFSRWLGLATGDFDEDGRVDLVTTSWGRNLRQQADSVHPLVLYAGQFNQDDVLDLLPARYDARLDAMAPLASFARLSRAVPEIAQRVRTFAAYADANVAAVLGPAEPGAFRLGATGFDQVVWFNRGGRFEPVTLPAEAQLAPAFGPVVADFDGDGHDDLILSQNFFPTDLNSPRYDAGRGLLLLGDGRGGFRPVSGKRSGLAVYGDQRGAAAADYDGDGRMDVVITQNGGPTRLFRNARGAAGIRVRLKGPAGNPFGFGATMRLRLGSTPAGPRREIQAGSGYWSQNSPVVVFGRPGEGPLTLDVRWPDGRRSEVAIAPGQREVVVTPP